MKPIRLILLLLAFSAVTFYACSDSDPVSQAPATSKSIALRTALNEIKKAASPTGRDIPATGLCFQFVYPIYLGYNNGTTVTVTSFTGLLGLLAQETANTYIASIAFPFQVQHNGAVETIGDEAAFTALLQGCGINTWNGDLGTSYCFDLVFPIQISTTTGPVTISSQEQFAAYLGNAANGTEANIIFPVSVLYNGQQMTVSDVYAFYQLINSCNSCVCTQEYAPVCVQTPVGVVTYGNMCYAECAGYTQNDLVSCTPNTQCNITNLTVSTGMCNATGYVVTLDFDYANAGSTTFEVHNSTGALVGTFPLSQLPITITNYLFTGALGADYLTVNISGNASCSASQQYTLPNCNSCPCPANVDPVCVQTANGLQQFTNACFAECAGYTPADFIDCGVAPTNFGTALGSCFNIVFPVQIMHQGAVVTANSNGDVLQYWFPNSAPIPAFVYPVTVTQTTPTGTVSTTIASQSDFMTLVNSCN